MYEYTISDVSGVLEFDGHWYAMEQGSIQLPCSLWMSITRTEPEPGVHPDDEKWPVIIHRTIEQRDLVIEVTAHTVITDTSVYAYEEEFDGDVCLFPTARQRIEFRVVSNTLSS
jgi:hypothetical protein